MTRNVFLPAMLIGMAMSFLATGAQDVRATAPAQELIGTWQGGGEARRTPARDWESVRCQVTAQDSGADTLRVRGRCASANTRGTFEIDISGLDTGTLRAVFTALDLNQSTRFTGSRSGDRMTLTSTRPVPLEDGDYRSRLTIDFVRDGAVSLRETVTPSSGGAASTIFDVDLTRQ
ncbi:MAG: hypothetical protein AAFX39_10740 [Pseudomonadota bacterium]